MSIDPVGRHAPASPPELETRNDQDPWWETFPWWAVLLGGIVGVFGYYTFFVVRYNNAYEFLKDGLRLTIEMTLWSFAIALALGLLAGLGRISRNVVARNLSRTYIEFIRGVPTLPMIFFITFVLVPIVTDFLGVDNQTISTQWRGTVALSLIYGGYIAEVFRGGIQSVQKGQMEAGRSLGLSYRSTMRTIVMPQALRNILPPLGNDFISILKDTSLISLLAVNEITQQAKIYSNASFQFRETYMVLTFMYLVLVLGLSLLLNAFEKYMTKDRKGER
jgi:polar amino acid transport system permease protein